MRVIHRSIYFYIMVKTRVSYTKCSFTVFSNFIIKFNQLLLVFIAVTVSQILFSNCIFAIPARSMWWKLKKNLTDHWQCRFDQCKMHSNMDESRSFVKPCYWAAVALQCERNTSLCAASLNILEAGLAAGEWERGRIGKADMAVRQRLHHCTWLGF